MVDACRACGGTHLRPYFNLGTQPLANDYTRQADVSRAEFPLVVNLCEACSHSQLGVVVDPALLFKHYLYVSGTTETYRVHCAEFARDVAKRRFGSVLDIGCNDGTLLRFFSKRGYDVYGVDPAENLRAATEALGIPVTTGFFPVELDRTFDVVTAANVFAHVDDAVGFLSACGAILKPNGLVAIEVPYCAELFKRYQFDTIYHEHLSYFLLNSLEAVVRRAGMIVVDLVFTPIHGGSVRLYISKSGEWSPKVADVKRAERDAGLYSFETYRHFSIQCRENITKFKALLDASHRICVGYGASAKGNTMLNASGVKLEYIVDENPLKVGLYCPGTGIPIVSRETLNGDKDDLLITLTAWNFADEIKRKVRSVRGRRDQFALYVPEAKIE